MISIEQKPLTLTPVNTEHIYTVESTNVGLSNYRYVFDLWVDTTTSNPEKITRLLVSPNTYSKGIINVEEIVRNYVEGNARSEEPQYTSEYTTGTTPYGLITNTKGITPSNAFNDDTNYNIQTQVRDYRVMVGEQYTSGNTTLTYISTGVTTPGSTFIAQVGGASNTDILWYGAGANIVQGSSLTPGITWVLTDQTSVFRGSGSSITIDGTLTLVEVIPAPDLTDYITITETYTGIGYEFNWQDIGENPQWVLTNIIYPTFTYQAFYSPPAVTIWPGTTLYEGSYIPNLTNNDYWTASSPDSQQEWWEAKTYLITGTTVNEEQPSRFLTTAGDKLFTINDGGAGIISSRVRRRKHHPSCPILLSWFNGLLSENPNFEFNNDLKVLNYSSASTQSELYGNAYENTHPYHSYTGITPQNERILYWNQIQPNLQGGKICYWLSNSIGEYQYDGYGYSEIMEYYIQEDNCLSDPIHCLFINRQGVWDTYTLNTKALETSSVTRDLYAQGGIRNTNTYSQLSTNRRKTIYNQDIIETMTVNTWFLDDNEKQILEDLFQSPEIYIIKNHNWSGKTEKSYNPYLLPVILLTNTIEEYKNRYNKLAQYTFSFEYSPSNIYNTQG